MSNLKHATQDLYLVTGFGNLLGTPFAGQGNLPGGNFSYYLFSSWPDMFQARRDAKMLSSSTVYVWIVKLELNAGDDAVVGFEEKNIKQLSISFSKLQLPEPATQYLYIVVNLKRIDTNGNVIAVDDGNNLWGVFTYSVHAFITKARTYAAQSRSQGYATWIHKWEVVFGDNIKAVVALAGL